MIEANVVVMGVTRPVVPGPTDGNSGLVEIEDVIVLPRVVRRLSDPDSTAPGCRRPPCDKTVPDDVVGYVHFRIVRYSFDLIPSPKPRVSDLHTAARQID